MDILPFRNTDDVSVQTRPNFPGFDAVRALAALGVVLLHACVPYLSHPMPGLAWPVRDTQSDVIDYLFWSIDLFIMPVFLVLAGFLAWQTLVHRGPAVLLRSRSNRLLKPLLFGMIVVLPMDLYAWILGWVAEGLVPMVKLRSLKIDGPLGEDLWGLAHLWFLQYLFLYVVAIAGWTAVRRRFAILQSLRPNVFIMACSVTAVGIATLAFRPQIVWGFQHAFEPVASKWIYSGTFFIGGAWIAVADPHLVRIRQQAIRLTAPAMMIGVASVALGRWHLAGGEGKLASTVLASTTVIAAWAITLSLLGLAARIRSVSMTVKYLAAASFWIYLVHHPILGIIHVDLKWLLPGANPILKSAFAFTITTGTCLLSYEALIRRTPVGQWLGFAWHPFDRGTADRGTADGGTADGGSHVRVDEAENTDFLGDRVDSPTRRAA